MEEKEKKKKRQDEFSRANRKIENQKKENRRK